MNLKDLARPAKLFNGTVTVWVMPYRTVKNDVIQDQFAAIVPINERWINLKSGETRPTPPLSAERTEWSYITDWSTKENGFLFCEGFIVDVEFADELAPMARPFHLYWTSRNGSIEANWNTYLETMGLPIIVQLMKAYNETRDAAYETLTSADPEADAATVKTSKRGGGSRPKQT